MKENENQTPSLKADDYIKIFDHNARLIHEGLLILAPGMFTPFRDDGDGLWTYFFKNLPAGVTVTTPHHVELADGTGYLMKAKSFIEPIRK